MLSMNGILFCELILGGVLISLIFASLANTDLIADASSKSKQNTQVDGFKSPTRAGRALTELSCQMYMSLLAGDYYWAKVTGAAPVS